MKQFLLNFVRPPKRLSAGRGSVALVLSVAAIIAANYLQSQNFPGGGSPVQSVPGPVFNVKDPKYGAVGDAKSDNTVAITAGQAAVVATDSPWVAGDAGKLIFCVFSGTPTNGFAAGTKIQTFTDANHVTLSNTPVGGSATYVCTWATQDDTAAFQAAYTAAATVRASVGPNNGSPTLSYPGTIYIPPGGYMLSGSIYDFNASSSNTLAPSFVGAGSSAVVLYPRSDTFTAGPRACFMSTVNGANFTWSGFYIFGSSWGFNCGAAGIPFIRWNASGLFNLKDIGIFDVGVTNGGSAPIANLLQANNILIQQVNMQGSSLNNSSGALLQMDSSAGILIEQSFISNNNNGPNLVFNSSGARNASGQQISMISGGSDECGGSINFCVSLNSASFVNFSGGSIFGEPTGAGHGALFVDGTSAAYLQSMNVGPFNTVVNSNGLAIASGGFVYATGSHIRGGGTTGSVIDGPAGATFVDDGGNTFQRCNSTTCTNITGTTYAGAFTSGIIPATSLTHTYPQPFLPALPASGTALNIVAFTPSNSVTVKNFTITAGNTPTCATPPTFQISNGTQSFIQTFASAAQISGPFTPAATLFPAGTQITLSITNAAYACATAPTNMNWSIEWQSAVSF